MGGGRPPPSPSQSTRGRWRSRPRCLDVLCSFGSGTDGPPRGLPAWPRGQETTEGAGVGWPPAPWGPAWTTSLSGSPAAPHPLPARLLTSCLPFQVFLLLTKYQELGVVCDFWIKYGRKGVSSLGPDKVLMKHCTRTQLTLLSPRKHLSFNLEMGTLGKG